MNHGAVEVMSYTVQELMVEEMPPNQRPSNQSLASPLGGFPSTASATPVKGSLSHNYVHQQVQELDESLLSITRENSSTSLSQLELDSVKLGVEGWASLSAGVGSQRNLQEYFQESTAANEDSHLVEFSDALQTVARALRQVAESKARTQDEATEWKRKYDLEVARCQQLRQIIAKTMSVDVKQDEGSKTVVVDAAERRDSDSSNGIHSPLGFGNGICCSKEGICSQQVIREQGSANSSPESENCSDKKLRSEKASFHLAWGCTGKSSRRHKHDIVSFESGNITTAVRSSKQITLQWDALPESVFILTKPNSTSVASLCREMIRWLKDVKSVRVFVELNVKKELVEEDSYYSFLQACERDEELTILHTKIDLVITLGGDGTVLWAANMFKGPVPPLVSFAMGSLGFMTPFQSDRYKECLDTVMKGPVYITLRHRLHCRIIRNKDKGEDGVEEDDVDHLVLNEVAIDRGMSSYLTNLECYCDNLFVTCVQGDGLILSTPSGSTAYSLAAGGSMVHPQVPGILFTPICPHSLSFRPLILPEHVTLRVQIPINSRGQAWASFDGKDSQQLGAGDALIVHMSAWPVPAACDEESTHDFLRSVREGLHWNLRKRQSFDGPREAVVYSS